MCLLGLVLWSIVLIAHGQTAPGARGADAAGDAFRAGIAAVNAHDLAAAEKDFNRVIRLAPDVSAGHSALGAVLVQQGRFTQALPELRRALELDPKDRPAQLNLGIASADVLPALAASDPTRRTTIESGIAAFTAWQAQGAAGSMAGLPPDAALAMAKLQLADGHADLAKRALEAALQAAPQEALLLDAMGLMDAQAGQLPEAIGLFRAALSASLQARPPVVEPRGEIELHLGAALLAAEDAAGAVNELMVAVELRPEDTTSRVQLGTAQFSAGQEAAALTTLREALRRDPHSDAAAYQLALTLESSGKAEESIPLFEQARKVRGNDPVLLTNLGLALVQAGRAKEAVPIYETALRQSPKDATVHQDLGVAYLQQSDLDRAIAEFRRAGELDRKSAEIQYDLGLALKLKDNLPEAISAFQKARVLDPTLADAPYTLGVLYMQQGQFNEAVVSLQQALQLRPENAEAWSMLGSVLKQDGKVAEAADALRKAIALDPGQPGNHVNLASVLVELGQKDEAVRERKTAADLSRVATAKQKERFALDSGKLLLSRGQFAEAVTQFRNAVAADPNDAAAHLALADALAQSGARTEADAERAKAKAITPK